MLNRLADVRRVGGAKAGELARRAAEQHLEWFVREQGHEIVKYINRLFLAGDKLRDEALRTPADSAAIDARHQDLHAGISALWRMVNRGREAVVIHGVHYSEEPLGALLEEARVAVVEQLPSRAARLEVVLDVEEGLVAHVDHYRFLPAMVDLIRNAAESYGEDAARMEVTATARARDRGRVLEVAVADRGRGISAESLPHVFSPFGTSKPGAPGMGLYLVRRAIEDAHGGRLTIESTRGEGTVARVFVPRKQAEVMPRRRLTMDEMADAIARQVFEAQTAAAKKRSARVRTA